MRIRERMPRPAERHRARRHRRRLLLQPASQNQKSEARRVGCIRRGDITVVRLAVSVERDDLALFENSAPRAEDEIDVALYLAMIELVPADVDEQRVLVPYEPHVD